MRRCYCLATGISLGLLQAMVVMTFFSLPAFPRTASALEAAVLESLPEDQKDIESQLRSSKAMKAVDLISAKGEGEPFIISLRGLKDKEFRIKVKNLPDAGWARCSFHRVGWVDVKIGARRIFRKADPLLPVPMDTTATSPDDPVLLWGRLSITRDAPSVDKLELTVQISSGDQAVEIPIRARIAPLPLSSDSPWTLQAALRRAEDRPDQAFSQTEVVDGYSFLAEYGVNAAAVGSKALRTEKSTGFYEELLNRAGMKKIRIEFLNTKQVFRKRKKMGSNPDALLQMKQNVKLDLEKNRDLIRKYPNTFIVKVWDEPRPNEYPMVRELAGYIKGLQIPVLIDITGSSVEELKDSASIFIPRLNELEIPAIRRVQAEGKQVWFYANRMHSVRNPYHTMRNIGWLLWSLRLDGYHIWSVNDWDASPYTMQYGRENSFGRGVFVYPGTSSSKVFNPSIRLEMLREGLEDYKIMKAIGEVKKVPCIDSRLNQYLLENYSYQPGEKNYLNNPKSMHDQLLDFFQKGSC